MNDQTLVTFDKMTGCVGKMYWLTGIKKDKSDMRHHIRYIKAEEGKVASTDGVELREIEVPIADGFYEVVKRTKTKVQMVKVCDLTDGSFPPYEKFLSTNGAYREYPVDCSDPDPCLYHIFKTWIEAGTEQTVDAERVLGLCEGLLIDSVFVNPAFGKPIIFTGEGIRAALMPCWA